MLHGARGHICGGRGPALRRAAGCPEGLLCCSQWGIQLPTRPSQVPFERISHRQTLEPLRPPGKKKGGWGTHRPLSPAAKIKTQAQLRLAVPSLRGLFIICSGDSFTFRGAPGWATVGWVGARCKRKSRLTSVFSWLRQVMIKFTFLNDGPLHAASEMQKEFSSVYCMNNLSPRQNSNRSLQWKKQVQHRTQTSGTKTSHPVAPCPNSRPTKSASRIKQLFFTAKKKKKKKSLKNLLFYQGTTCKDYFSGWVTHCVSENSGRKTNKLTQNPKKQKDPCTH